MTTKIKNFFSISFLVSRFSFLVLLLTFTNTYAQVIIKEKVEINPQQNVVLKPLAQHIIRIELQWTPTNIPGAIINYDETGNYPCRNTGGSGSQTGGNLSYQIVDVVGGQYNLQFRFNIPCQNPPVVVEAQYSIYYDGTFIRTGSFSLANCYNGITFPFHNTTYRTPLITDYSFGFYSQDLCFGSYEPIELPLGLGCTNTEIDTSTEIVNLQILSGGEYASFYGYEGMVTDNLTLPHSMLDRVELRQDEFYSGNEMNVIVQSNLGGIIKQDQIVIHPKSSYGLEVSYVNYPIEYNETKYIEISPVGPGGCRAEFPPDILLNAEIIKGSELGQLQDFDTGQMGDNLYYIPIQTFGGNPIGFVADGNRKETIDTVIVKYFTTEPEIESVEVLIIIWPGSIYIALEPDSISAGQTADIIIKRRNIDGTLEDFNSTQTFEIGIFDGCDLSYLIAGADTAKYFNEVMMPIKYLAVDSIESGGIVKIKGGPIEEIIIGRAGKKEIIFSKNVLIAEDISQRRTEGELKQLNHEQIIDEEIITDDPVSSSCFSGNFNIYSIGERSFFVGDDCDEKIVVCNNYTPPLFENVSTITELGENHPPWTWIDKNGKLQTINASNGCNATKSGDLGITYIMTTIGDPTISQQPVYKLLDDMVVTACADKSNPNPDDRVWRFSVKNMRVPIFRDHCPSWATTNGYIDFLDGKNVATLAHNIKNCIDYTKVMEALDWWWIGVYRQTVPLPHNYYFSAGVIAHENIHVKQMKDGGTKFFSVSALSQVMNGPDGLPNLARYNKFSLIVYKCPEDVLNALWGKGGRVVAMKKQIENELAIVLNTASDLEIIGGYDGQLRIKSELEADELSRTTYDEIKKSINNWAKQQSWWCNLIVAGYLDCEGQTCTP